MAQKSQTHEHATAKLIATSNEVFNKKLLPILSKNSGNLVYSPISAHAILSLAYQGAAGEIAQSLENVLGLTDTKTVAEGYRYWMKKLNSLTSETVNISNKIFINYQYPLKKEFNSNAKEFFLAEAENVNFAKSNETAKKINQWVAEKTKDLIKDIADPNEFSNATCIFMVNTIYFKGYWYEEFCSTHESKFYISETDTVDCTMLSGIEEFKYGEEDDLDAQILSIPYKSRQMSLLVILPRSKSGVDSLYGKLETKNLYELNESLATAEVSISLPKCKIETTVNLNEPLSDLGLGVMFSYGAQFPNMLTSPTPVKVSKIVQKAFIDINEKGTEAAAATGFKIGLDCDRRLRRVEFNADHPFVFCLCYYQQEMLLPTFAGILRQPNKK